MTDRSERTVGTAAYRARQIANAIAECDRYIAKEGRRDPALRPAAIQQLLDWYIAKREALQQMQANG